MSIPPTRSRSARLRRHVATCVIGWLLSSCGGAPGRPPLDAGDPRAAPSMEALPSLDVSPASLGDRFSFAWRLAAEALDLPPPTPPEAPSAAELRAFSDGPLAAWLQEKSRRVEAARQEWDAVAEEGRRQRIVAGAIVGLLYEDVARSLLQVPIPRELRDEPEIAQVFRELVIFQARPYLTHGRRAYHACAANSVPLESMHHWGRFCARRADALPREDPSAASHSPGSTEVTVTVAPD